MVKTAAFGLVALGALSGVTALSSYGLPDPILVDFDDDGVVGGLYRPNAASPLSRIGVYVMHAEQDYLNFSACHELPKRGFTTFCANNDASKSGYMTDLDFEEMMTNVAQGMSYLRNLTEIDKVVIFGHSGGGAMMAAYQNIAENGVSACNGPERIYPCSDAMAGLPAADGLMLIDANYGLSTMSLLSLNPAIVDEHSGSKIDQSLNLYNPANGFSESGANYTASFKKAFQSGVVARNNRILAHAESRLAAINNGTGIFSDDEPFYIVDSMYVGFNNKFFAQDTRWIHHTTQPWPLLHRNGSITKQIVPSVRVPANFENFADNFEGGAIKTTIKRYLSTLAVRVTDDFEYKVDGFEGIVWNSSQTAPLGNIGGVTVPLLNMGMTGHYEYLNAEKLHLAAGSKDAAIAFVEGAQHTIVTCTECESYPGEFGNTLYTAYNFMAEWLSKEGRFL
ncbi:uncharacterized protein BO80DRAFT_476736 [Aspergillus ibericus CBS 121593]|uniref:Alpha/beta-hydrolase n=1 Tax=Aspergillus ibericus CBS 121593 TaxID=1448316 RepID=A0A395GXR8_9EURO|nr:hypothetical protein BO80DRAFT_476736 [Aspergillus ibericus CBS 121593]RAL00150.1 hypothetical protein BO80DRAFT_476736 [Aspergillus ibericus CBS 121593]